MSLSKKRFYRFLCLILFPWGPVKSEALFIYLINEDHYTILENYTVTDHIAHRTEEISRFLEQSLGKPLNNDSFRKFFFTRKNKIKGNRENRTRVIYIYLDQWRAGRFKMYASPFEKLKLTAKDLDEIKYSLSKREQYILDSLIFLWMPVWTSPLKAPWKLSNFPEGRQEFEFLWALLTIEKQLFDPFTGKWIPSQGTTKRNASFERAKNLLSKLAKRGFVPALHGQGFMDLMSGRNLPSALVKFEKSYQEGYRPDVCSAVLAHLYRKLHPLRTDKAEYYLTSAIYTHDYELMKGELLDLYLETHSGQAFRIARQITENFTNFAANTFLRSMEQISLFSYAQKNFEEAFLWMEIIHIAAGSYTPLDRLPEYEHYADLKQQLPLKEQRQISAKARIMYHAMRRFLIPAPLTDEFSDDGSCRSRFLQ